MVDLVTTQTLLNGPRHLVMRFTDVSDGSGETDVLKVDATDAVNGWVIQGQTIVPGISLKLVKVRYACTGMGLRLRWAATTPEDILALGGFGTLNFEDTGGIQCPGAALAGATGSILFSTINADAGDDYWIELVMSKGLQQQTAAPVLVELESAAGRWLFENDARMQWG